MVRDELVRGMLELAEQDEWTLFISSHDLEEIENLVDYVGFLNEGKMLLSEELDQLRSRFCEIEVTLPAAARIPDDWPAAWLFPQASRNVIRFTDSKYDQSANAALVARIFPEATDSSVTPLSLRSIFIALTRLSSSATAKEI